MWPAGALDDSCYRSRAQAGPSGRRRKSTAHGVPFWTPERLWGSGSSRGMPETTRVDPAGHGDACDLVIALEYA